MSLKALINRSKKFAEFFGPGTFGAKDRIKSLGRARWNSERKVWAVEGFSLSDNELSDIFPGIEIEVDDADSDSQETASKPALKPITLSPRNGSGKREASSQGSAEADDISAKGLSVTQLLNRSRIALQTAFPGRICVYGVLNSVKEYSGGRAYMELAELDSPDARVTCVIWRDMKRLSKGLIDAGFELEKDLQVMFEVQVDLNPRDARMSLTVTKIIHEYTLSKVAALRDVTNERLKKEGLFDKNKDFELPFLPRRLGILTSKGGTVIHDFRSSLDVSEFAFQLYWRPVSVQGSEARAQIVKGIQQLSKLKGLDCILLFRGGGSPAELAVFSDYEVAKAICECPLPVLSAIGHQEDQSSTQDVSFRAFGVPKDVGRFFSDIVLEYRARVYDALKLIDIRSDSIYSRSEESLRHYVRGIHQAGFQFVSRKSSLFHQIGGMLPGLSKVALTSRFRELASTGAPLKRLALHIVERRGQALLNRVESIQSRAERAVERSDSALTTYEQVLREASPEVQLKRGFSLVRSFDGEKVFTSGEQLSEGERVQLQFHDVSRVAEIVSDKKK